MKKYELSFDNKSSKSLNKKLEKIRPSGSFNVEICYRLLSCLFIWTIQTCDRRHILASFLAVYETTLRSTGAFYLKFIHKLRIPGNSNGDALSTHQNKGLAVTFFSFLFFLSFFEGSLDVKFYKIRAILKIVFEIFATIYTFFGDKPIDAGKVVYQAQRVLRPMGVLPSTNHAFE